MAKTAYISPDVHILTTRELDDIKHAEYRRGRDNAFADMADKSPRCHAGRDGDCTWELCPQNKKATRKPHCPLDTHDDDE